MPPEDTKTPLESIFPLGGIQDHSQEAKVCSECGRTLLSDSIRYINGQGFCNKGCEAAYFNKERYGSTIQDTLNAVILPAYAHTDIDRLKDGLVNPSVVDRVLSWRLDKRGLVIIGKTGCGKTRALSLLLRKLITVDLLGIRQSLKVFYAGELERTIMSSFNKKAVGYDVLMRHLEDCGLLVIDDFGKERFTERYEVSVFQIFEKRTANLRPTIFTTNYNGETLKARFSDQNNYEPFARRLNEFCDRVVFTRKERQ